ncbi:MAG: DUF4190 domain-containing protein [Firmicutes bacterium]|nr:DUF4190 domain-containing protein [Bacillota bacterium]MDY5531214.1 DUF4190 domain-containing protein [Pumilibacteraceae bacterium]
MYCKYCGEKLDGSIDVCPKCEEKLSRGVNPYFAPADPVYRDPVKQLKEEVFKNNPDAAIDPVVRDAEPLQTAPSDEFLTNDDKSRSAANAAYSGSDVPYTDKSGLMFGILSVTLPFVGLFVFFISFFVLLDVGFGNGVLGIIILFSLSLPPFIIALVFGIKAIKTFKKAKEYGVKPVATLVLGIIGVAHLASTVLVLLEVLVSFAIGF